MAENEGPRPHERFFYSSGDITIQVENIIFKIHRLFLVQHSTILRDLLEMPHDEKCNDGTDQMPLLLQSDNVQSWELLLGSFYRIHAIGAMNFDGDECLAVLRIAHKYCMDSIEEEILTILKKAKTTPEYVYLMAASNIVDSTPLYQQALKGLTGSKPELTSQQARLIGVNALYDIFVAIPARSPTPNPTIPQCGNCNITPNRYQCYSCRQWVYAP